MDTNKSIQQAIESGAISIIFLSKFIQFETKFKRFRIPYFCATDSAVFFQGNLSSTLGKRIVCMTNAIDHYRTQNNRNSNFWPIPMASIHWNMGKKSENYFSVSPIYHYHVWALCCFYDSRLDGKMATINSPIWTMATIHMNPYFCRSPKIEVPAHKFINTLCQLFGNEHHTPSNVLFLFVIDDMIYCHIQLTLLLGQLVHNVRTY